MIWLLDPLKKWLAAAGAVLALVAVIYGRGRRDARQKIEGQANADALRRTQDAARAGDAVDRSPGRLRDNDGHRRD